MLSIISWGCCSKRKNNDQGAGVHMYGGAPAHNACGCDQKGKGGRGHGAKGNALLTFGTHAVEGLSCKGMAPAWRVCSKIDTCTSCCDKFTMPSQCESAPQATLFLFLLGFFLWASWAILYSLATLLASFSWALLNFCLSLSSAFFILSSSLSFYFCSFSCCTLSLFSVILSSLLRC